MLLLFFHNQNLPPDTTETLSHLRILFCWPKKFKYES